MDPPPGSNTPDKDKDGDIISIKNLQLPVGVTAPDVWSKAKEQPALLTLTVVLKTTFASAASRDKLDESTIHYGELAKRVRSACGTAGQTAEDVIACAERVIGEMGIKGEKFIVARSEVEVYLPKASTYGDGITLNNVAVYDDGPEATGTQMMFGLEDVKLMLLVGVNGYERGGRQPIYASLWLIFSRKSEDAESAVPRTAALFRVEQTLVEITSDTAFETLESLAEHTVQELQKRLLNETLPGSQLRLRLEKPRAIAFADAPAVEVSRETPGGLSSRAASVRTVAGGNGATLNVVKPYLSARGNGR
ncbi:hypothetical protein LTR53_008729 [Teratosphaeriaceae sp. CCFEE 6253]|nr:hypothetical protein LTR53_008729 [Teratosphaeriaceae sp. CCFEE 6253]